MMINFRTFQIATEFYQACQTAPVTGELRNQLIRASSSVALNLAEGRGKHTRKEQLRYFHIAMGSLRESQAALILERLNSGALWTLSDKLGASLYLLIRQAR